MNIQLMTVAAATLAFPTDGNGARTAPYGTPKVSASGSTFTATGFSATFGAGAGPSETNAVANGDYVYTSDGCWGVIASASGASATAASVDYWRSVGQPNRGSVPCIPLAGSTITIHNGKCHLVGSRRPCIKRIIFRAQVDTKTCIVTDAKGTTVYTHTLAGTVPSVLDFTGGADKDGRFSDGPFGILTNDAGILLTVEYVP